MKPQVTVVPSTPEVKAVPAVEGSVTVQMSINEAEVLVALIGKTTGDELYSLYQALNYALPNPRRAYSILPVGAEGQYPRIEIKKVSA